MFDDGLNSRVSEAVSRCYYFKRERMTHGAARWSRAAYVMLVKF